MATLGDSLVSSSARKLPIRMRPDLSARRQQYLGRSYWVVKEPVGLNYYRFQDEEYAILQMLDGHTSLDEIKERFEAEFPPQKITLEELQQFLGMLHRSGLVIAAVGGQGHQLRKRRDERRKKEMLGAATNLLCIKFKGFDPERFLNWLYPYVAWFFTKKMLFLNLLLATAAATLVLVQFEVFQSKLPGFYQFFSPGNALLMAATLGIIKVFHEFGHGLSCKHFGGECHEMGVMILVLTPCLYCNVSDSWMLPSKWQRAAIGAAGIYVEVVIASICTFLWWFSESETLFNNLCLNAMFVASVSTIFFNANPLLRYDGYYILADITEIPNLRQKATTILSRKMGWWFLGLEPPEDPFLPQRNQIFFALYSMAAAVYRWFVLASILWFMYQIFKPYRLEIIGQGIIATSLIGLVVMPLYKLGKFFYVPGRIDKVKKPRMYASLTGLAALVAAVVYIPLPHSVMATFEVDARDAAPVYVSVPEGGRLDDVYVQPGDHVVPGDQLATLTNVDLHLEVSTLIGELRKHDAQINSLERQRRYDKDVGGSIPALEEARAAVEKQLIRKQTDTQRLSLVAPARGTILQPPTVNGDSRVPGQLPGWSGTPFQKKNRGAYLDRNVLFCKIGDPNQLWAILVLDQTNRLDVRRGQEVEIRLDGLPHDTLLGHITEIAEGEIKAASDTVSTRTGGELPTETDPTTGMERPQSTSYQARVPLGFHGHGTVMRNSKDEYEWMRGELQQDENGWRIRFLPAESATDDPHGGVMPLGNDSRIGGFSSGDFVEILGHFGPANGGADSTDVVATDMYQITKIRAIDPANDLIKLGMRGSAKIHADWLPLGTRVWRLLRHTFSFKM